MDSVKSSVGPSWTWLVGALMTLLLFFGAYGWNSIDARISNAEDRTSELSIKAATNEAHYMEIIRRLDNIERMVEFNRPSVRIGIPPDSHGFGVR